MVRRRGPIIAAFAALTLAMVGWLFASRGYPPTALSRAKPNVVLIEICSLRYDHLGCTGYDRPTSPTIDALASAGVLFGNCISQSSWTKPSTASILTGLGPNVHGLTEPYSVSEITAEGFMPTRALSPDVVTIAEALKLGGYQTAGFVANVNAWPVFGVSQGFDHYDYAYPRAGHALVHRLGDWLRGSDPKKPFFAFMLFFDVHHAYDPPYAFYESLSRDENQVSVFDYPSYRAGTNFPFLYSIRSRPDPDKIQPGQLEQWVDLYDGAVRTVDHAVEEVVEELVAQHLDHNTAILVVADHGDSLGEHNRSGHGNSLYQELVHVPLVMYLPGIRGGQVVDRLVRSIDIYPTVCEYCGVPVDAHVQGRSLLSMLKGKEKSSGATIALSSMGNNRNAIQDGRWKLVRYGKMELFDLESDPGETRDLSTRQPVEFDTWRMKLAEAVREDEELKQTYRASSSILDRNELEQLKSLGYIK